MARVGICSFLRRLSSTRWIGAEGFESKRADLSRSVLWVSRDVTAQHLGLDKESSHPEIRALFFASHDLASGAQELR